jgi:hypothetical protein
MAGENMLRDFADWLRLARPELTPAVVILRWSAVETFEQSVVDARTALDVVRLSYKLPPRDEQVRERLETALQETDASFPLHGNDYELHVIAATVAMLLLEKESDVADVIALASIAANAADFRTPAVLPALVPKSEKYVAQRGNAVRRTSLVALPQVSTTVSNAVNEYVKADATTGDAAPALKAISAAIQTIADGIGVIADANTRSVDILMERSEMLWYAIGSHDLASGKHLKTFGNAAPLVVAADIATITRFRVPPLAARAVMLRTLTEALGRKGARRTSITDSVGALNGGYRTRFTGAMLPTVTSDLCPVHEAISWASNNGTTDVADVLRFDGQVPWEADQIAYQAYIERLLIVAATDVK